MPKQMQILQGTVADRGILSRTLYGTRQTAAPDGQEDRLAGDLMGRSTGLAAECKREESSADR